MSTQDSRGARRALPAHPARRLVFTWGLLGAIFLALGVNFLLSPVTGFAAGIVLVCGLFFVHQSFTIWRRIPAAQHLNLGAQALSRGAFDEVRAELARISTGARRDPMVRRSALLQESMIALYEGNVADAEAITTQLLANRRGFLTAEYEAPADASALAVRAFARVAQGDLERARGDADAAEASPWAGPEIIARARVVKAVVVSRSGDQEALRKVLAENNALVLEHGLPRERMLFRALRRMSRTASRSVYREPARKNDDHEPSKTASWIATIAPEAAAYTAGDRMFADSVEEAQLEPVRAADANALQARAQRLARTPVRRTGAARRVVVLWAVLIGMFAGIWQFLTPAPHHTGHAAVAMAAPPSAASGPVPAVLSAVFFVLFMAFVLGLVRRRNKRFLQARRLVTLGDLRGGTAELLKLTAIGVPLTVGSSCLELARLAARAGDFVNVVAYTDRGIAAVRRPQIRAAASDLLLPALIMESAVANAARGATAEATAELGLLEHDFSTFGSLALAQLRVHFLMALRTDRGRARQLAKARTAEMKLPYREDMLADLVLATHGDLDETDRERVDAELAEDAQLREWVDRVAPGLRADRPAATRTRVAEPIPMADAGELAELDAIPPVAMHARRAP